MHYVARVTFNALYHRRAKLDVIGFQCIKSSLFPYLIEQSKRRSTLTELECVWNVMAHGDAREGKWRGNWRMECLASTLPLPRNVVYPALLPLIRTPRLPAVDWTDAPADLNGLVRFGERRNLVSARVPWRFKRTLPSNMRYKWTANVKWRRIFYTMRGILLFEFYVHMSMERISLDWKIATVHLIYKINRKQEKPGNRTGLSVRWTSRCVIVW